MLVQCAACMLSSHATCHPSHLELIAFDSLCHDALPPQSLDQVINPSAKISPKKRSKVAVQPSRQIPCIVSAKPLRGGLVKGRPPSRARSLRAPPSHRLPPLHESSVKGVSARAAEVNPSHVKGVARLVRPFSHPVKVPSNICQHMPMLS